MRLTTGLWLMKQPGWRLRSHLAMYASTHIRSATTLNGCWKASGQCFGSNAVRKGPKARRGHLVRLGQLAQGVKMGKLARPVQPGQLGRRVLLVQRVALLMSLLSCMHLLGKQIRTMQMSWLLWTVQPLFR